MLIADSFPRLLFIRTAILGIRLITPASLVFCAASIIVRPAAIPRSSWLLALTAYCSAESLFYLCGYLPLRLHLQKPPLPQTELSKEDRKVLITKCFERISNADRYVSKWFLDADPTEIKRENLKDFLAWSLLDRKYEELTEAQDVELDEIIDQLEDRLNWKFEPGWGKARPLKLAFDAVPIQHRPLLWYGIVAIVECYTIARLNYNGFGFHRLALTDSLVAFPCRPHTFFSRNQSESGKLSYWYKPHTSKRRSPVLFIHGIGIGLYAYVDFLIEINANEGVEDDGDVGIIAVEVMPISSRIAPTALSATETREEIKKILTAHEWGDIVLVGHSYGSAIAASILRDPIFPTTSIKMAFLLDPISFMLHLPDVAYNFTRRHPSSASEWMLRYFTSTDLLISHTIARRFQWKDLILFKDDIPSKTPLIVTLSGRDIIVPASEVWQHLTGTKIEDEVNTVENDSEWDSQDGRLHVFWFANFNHADLFAKRSARRGVASMLRLQNIADPGRALQTAEE